MEAILAVGLLLAVAVATGAVAAARRGRAEVLRLRSAPQPGPAPTAVSADSDPPAPARWSAPDPEPGPEPDPDPAAAARRAFVGIARRVQAIVHQQLGELREMEERHGADPAVFGDLLRLDHGTALIGRLADSLVVIGGQTPGRQWTEPVPLLGVLRGAMSRILEYRRVEIGPLPDLAVAGRAVEPAVHALAELLDNATRYSPPDARVRLTARAAEDRSGALLIEIDDAGVGLGREAAARAARLLAGDRDAAADRLDLDDLGRSPRLGLAVVGRLARAAGFEATVRSGPGGGTRAVVTLPAELVTARGAGRTDAPNGTPTTNNATASATAPATATTTANRPTATGPGESAGPPAVTAYGLPQRRRARSVPEPGSGSAAEADSSSRPGPGSGHGLGPTPLSGSATGSTPLAPPSPASLTATSPSRAGLWLGAFHTGLAGPVKEDEEP